MVVIVGECSADMYLEGVSMIKCSGSAEIDCGEAAVIAGRNAEIKVKRALGVIVCGDSFEQKTPRGIQLISCGISSKETVSVTSRTEEKLTLSLNRSIRAKSGICEPLETPVDIPSGGAAEEYDIMAAFAARLLLGL